MQAPTPARQVAAIQRRLERWELDHLRTHAAQQAERIESLERELYRTQDDAEYWHRECQNMVEQMQADGREVGLTQAGELVLMPTASMAAPTERADVAPQSGGHDVISSQALQPLMAGALHLTNSNPLAQGGAANPRRPRLPGRR